MKKYRVKKLKKINENAPFTLVRKWFKNGIEKCVIADKTGYERIVDLNDLEEVKTKSNNKSKK